MTIKLADYRAHIKNVARTNRFILTMGNHWTGVTLPENFKFSVTKTVIPKVDITGPTIKYRGTSLVLPGDYKKDPLTVTFWNESRWEVRKFFEDWIAFIANYSSLENQRSNMTDNRFGTWLLLKQIGRNEEDLLAEYQFDNAIPLVISEIELDQTAENSLEDFTVDFYFSHFNRTFPLRHSELPNA